MYYGSKLLTMVRTSIRFILILAFAAILVPRCVPQTTAANGQQQTKRLILKDGSFQPVVKYEIQGDNVHYLSAERYEWEDVPSSLVDWDATKKYEADFSQRENSRPCGDSGREGGARERGG